MRGYLWVARRGIPMAVRGPSQRAPGEVRRRPAARRASPRLHVSLLEGFAVSAGDTLMPLPHTAARVVALAALERSPLSRSRAALMLWPDLPTARAGACLRATLSRLAPACPGLVASDRASLSLAPDVTVDVRELDQLMLSVPDGDAPDELLLRQLAVELLPGWEEDWVAFERCAVPLLRQAASRSYSWVRPPSTGRLMTRPSVDRCATKEPSGTWRSFA